ncbi:hypothetical protein G3N55_07515 [Dissulfurirhabdus thermomarina]|uniref:Uncharacterized protein n=1 Tax=Dissulfurirhabdus thermomarina TaxID=1765737 RepID=A0A6N9TW27_DISTH|nr:hypothetical protein [Dissulfurirhabdus thermomarina]NDY42686.1 hypothetical protein [Dissulfurirhabdus thermomarina]NMX24096.1 hypothetical protein [Dissulfurirhabdus thermomarina]
MTVGDRRFGGPGRPVRRRLLLALSVLLAAGCGPVGPTVLQQGRNGYNIAIQRSNDEQLLLNLVRLRYRDTPFFLEVSSVSSQFTFEGSATLSGTANEKNPDVLGLGTGVGFSERPTVSFTPLQGEKFVRMVLSPVSLDSLVLLCNSGWSVERVFRTCVQRMNGLRNAPSASGPTPATPPEYAGFVEATRLLRRLQQRDAVAFAFEKEAGAFVPVLRLAPAAAGVAEVRRLTALVGPPGPGGRYRLYGSGAGTPRAGDLVLQTRSLLGILFFLSQAVSVPEADEAAGRVTVTRGPGGEKFDWGQVVGDILRIRHSASRPAGAAVAIRYRGRWFYLDDTDLDSKSTFSLLAQLVALQSGRVERVTPLLTLPVGQ